MKTKIYVYLDNSITLPQIYQKFLFILLITLSPFLYGQQTPDTPRYRTLKYLVSKKDIRDTLKIANTNFQNNSYVANLIPPTPEAAALGTYGNNPVSLSSGVASIPIPLYQIKQKDLSIDLALSYHGGGVRLEEVAPWTGLSISLVGLGTITRTIRGSKADESTNGFMGISYNLDSINVWYENNSNLMVINQFKNDYTAIDPIDTEADLFNFNFGKYSGKFVYNRTDGVFYTIPRQNLKVEHNSDFSTWTITTPEGIKYVFGTSETTTSIVSNCSSSVIGAGTIPNATTAWHLTQIISPTDPNNIITINYLSETVSMTTNGSSKRYALVSSECGGAPTFINNCQTTITTISAKVSEIIFRNGKITFQRSVNNRCDNGGNGKMLQRIILYDADNQRLKATRLYHSYFGSQQVNDATCGTNNFMGRLRLDSLKTFGITDNDSLPPYILEYEPYSGALPSTRSYAQDHWGYYNGATGNDNLIPQFKYLNPYTFKWDVIGSNSRETSPIYVKFNQIKKITYPTGGRSEFEFEANRYHQATCDPSNCLNEESTTKQQICLYDAVSSNYPIVTFTINQGASCLSSCQNGVLADFTAIGSLLGTGFNNVQFRLSSTNPAFTTINITSPSFLTSLLPNGTYTLRAFYSGGYDPALDETYIRLTWKEALSSDIPVGGLRIKKITDYDENANVVSLKKYYYNQEGSTHSSASIGTIPYYGQFTFFQGNACINSGILLSGESTYPLINTQGATVNYTRVEVHYGETGGNGKSVHTFTPIASFQNNFKFPVVAPFMQDWKEGLSLKNSLLSATNISLKADSSHHDFNISSSLSLFKSSTGLRLAIIPIDRLNDIYFINAYQTPTDWFFTDYIEESIYHTNGSDAVKMPKWFRYNNQNFMPSLIKTINSIGDTLKTEIKYPHDFSTDPIYTGMLLKNQSGMVIEESEYVKKVGNSSYNFLMKKRNNFTKINNTFYAPTSLETQYAGGSLTQETSIEYTNDALVSSVTERNGITSTFTWFTNTDIGKRDLLKTMVKGAGSTIAQTTNFDYKPLVGLSVVTPPTNYAITYQYDSLSRLRSIEDALSFQMKRIFYHYRGQRKPYELTLDLPKSSNYIATFTARNAQTTLDSVTNNSNVSISYMDGLGKTTQQILFKGSPQKTKDILTTSTYDSQSRLKLNYLPTPSDVNTGVPKSNFQSLAKSFYDNDDNPFSETIYEESPLNRPLQTFGAGKAWRTANKFVQYDYLTAGGGFLDFKLTPNGATGSLTGLAVNTLTHSQITSERGAKTIELKDRLGRVLYKLQQLEVETFNYAITSYIYDDLNRLSYVLPPEVSKQVGVSTEQIQSFTEDDVIFKEGIYAYHYDNARGRISEKHIPGAGWVQYVYDKNDRVVLEHDEQDGTNYWKMTRYDALSRPIMTGLITGIGSTTRQTLQTAFDGVSTLTYEERATDANSLLGYTNRSFPSASIYSLPETNVKTVMYYDDYTWQSDTAYNFKSTFAFHPQANAKSLMTGTLIRNLETNAWYKYVNFYDYKGRIIQQFMQNNVGGIDRIDYQYRFNGEVLKMRITHKKIGAKDIIELYEYSYDHMGRKTSFTHNNNLVAKYEYDAVGRLQTKKFKPVGVPQSSKQTGDWTNSNTWLSGTLPLINDNVTINTGHTVTIPSGQTAAAGTLNDKGILRNFGTLNMGKATTSDLYVETFQYKIRGGLRGLNLDANGNLTNALFSFKLGYEDAGFYDGNIGKQEWKSNIDNVNRSYTYTYDGASRIETGLYLGNGTENYSLNNVSYDKNGNITNLSRNGWKANNTFGLVDNLNYTYNTNSNKILKVDDVSSEMASFRDVTGNDYTYNLDGSLASDANKGITIEYNYLKKPKKITFSNTETIEYQYDANGKKIREKDKLGIWTDYVGNKIYKNNVLYQIVMDEGRIDAQGEYEYGIQDHLGNIRVMFRDSLGVAKITQTENFGVWGESLSKLNYYRTANNKQQFVYTGHERNEELGVFDAKARVYDPTVPRFWQQDIMTEKHFDINQYAFVNNNPLIFVDLDGNDWFYYSEKGADPTWHWHDGNKYDTKIKDSKGKNIILTGVSAVVVFEGSRFEKLGEGGKINSDDAINANVTVYGPGGKDDVYHFKGYTMSSDAVKFGAIDEGLYDGNYDETGKSGALKSNWAVEARGRVRMMDGKVNPYSPTQKDDKGEGYKDGIFIHTSNSNGFAGSIHGGKSGISVGCLLITPNDWRNFNDAMSGVSSFKVQVIRQTLPMKNNAFFNSNIVKPTIKPPFLQRKVD